MFYRRLRIPGTKKVRRNIKQKSKGKNVKKSGLPKGETIGDIMTKLRPAKKD